MCIGYPIEESVLRLRGKIKKMEGIGLMPSQGNRDYAIQDPGVNQYAG